MIALVLIILFSPAFIVGGISALSKCARALPARRM